MENPSTPVKRPFFRGQPVFGLIFVLVGLGALYLFGQTVRLACTRQDGGTISCTLQTSAVGLVPLRSATVAGLQSARLGHSCNGGGNCSYRVELVGANGTTAVTDFYSTGKTDKQALADQINRFEQDSAAQTLQAEVPLNPLTVLFCGVFVAAGIFAMFVPMRPGHHYHHH